MRKGDFLPRTELKIRYAYQMARFQVPVLPIPEVVFFPNTSLPMVIVEPVYVKMVKDCIRDQGHLAVAMAEPIEGVGPRARWLPRCICTLGMPILLQEFSDGSIRILLKGMCRIRLRELKQNLPYLIFEAEPMLDQLSSQAFEDDKIERLKLILDQWSLAAIADSVDREHFLQGMNTTRQIVDYISLFLIKDSEMRQVLLENTCLNERVQMLDSLLRGKSPTNEDRLVAHAIKSFERLEKSLRSIH
jgi:Lon protease-like protein